MKEEIKVGVEFLRQFLAKYGNGLNKAQIDAFSSKLSTILEERYVNHWYTSMPMKGQAFRCLRVKKSENYVDPVLEQILNELNFNLNQLGLPNDFTLWIDPGEVSVRFGDQVGFTYTIARLNHQSDMPKTNNSRSSSPSILNNNDSIITDKLETKSLDKPKPCLIVQNAEKILFDEKLTAFIRENSCSNNDNDLKESNLDVNNSFLSTDLAETQEISNDFIVDELIRLSAEKRTISPPAASLSKSFANSSNIAIGENNVNQAVLSSRLNDEFQINKFFVKNANLNSNRLSFNDSCYYSSSSSSCASSFGSNNEESNLVAQLNWFSNNQNNSNNRKVEQQQEFTSILKKSSLNGSIGFGLDSIGKRLGEENNSFQIPFGGGQPSTLITNNQNYESNMEFLNQKQQQQQQQHAFRNSNMFSGFSNNNFSNNNNPYLNRNSNDLFNGRNGVSSPFESFGNNNIINNNNNNRFSNNYVNLANLSGTGLLDGANSIYSETSSERSDTPNSCITNASSSYMMIPSPSSSSFTIPFSLMQHQQQQQQQVPFFERSSNFIESNDLNNLQQQLGASVSTGSFKNSKKAENSASSSNSSNSSTSTLATNTLELSHDLRNFKLNQQSEQEFSSNKANDSVTPPSSPENDNETSSPMNNNEMSKSNEKKANDVQKQKKEESYCGYVESFPYYYKLNRLYNALAVQKMQTERLRKSGLLNSNNTTSNSPVSFSPTTPPNAATTSITPTTNTVNMANSTVITPPNSLPFRSPSSNFNSIQKSNNLSPNHYNQNKHFLINSPSSSPSNMSSFAGNNQMITAGSPSSSTSSSFINGFNNQMMHVASKSQINTIKTKTNIQQQNGYPMTPINAAISFANHQSINRKSNNQIQKANMQNFQKNNMFSNGNNNFETFTNKNNNNSLFPLIQQKQQQDQQQQKQQQQQQEQQNQQNQQQQKQQHQQQQQILNSLYNQMNLIR